MNNVAVALQHAHQAHDIDRVLIFDIDLHHGKFVIRIHTPQLCKTDHELPDASGTQSLVWDINAKAAEAAASQSSSPKGKGRSNATSSKRPLRVFYGSLHDILSYPCETGDPQIVANASVRLAAHDQHICNVHLQPYSSQSQFHTQVYPSYQKDLFGAATEFCKATQADPSRTLIVVSAGQA